MGEFDEFAEALFGQLSVEIDEEKEIAELGDRAREGLGDRARFRELEDVAGEIMTGYRGMAQEFLGVDVPDSRLEFPELADLKRIKGQKVFAAGSAGEFVAELFDAVSCEDQKRVAEMMQRDTAKYLVYSTYAIQYISKITTTYGDYMDGGIYLNKFILSRYPQIILFKQGEPFESGFKDVNSGYTGAVKMTVLEELVHSAQGNLHDVNRRAASEVNRINEELAGIILSLDDGTVNTLSEYCQLQAVPDDFPFAKKANLFFFLNPDHFLTEQIGPDVMTFTHVEIDPKIGQAVPELLDIYKRWLVPIQQHHAAFTAMEGMAGFAVEEMLGGDPDFKRYLATFMGTDMSSYQVRKGMGTGFVRTIHGDLGRDAFSKIIDIPPNTRELKDAQLYLKKLR
ncbi:MAG: hypothetical protein EB829_02330 [Nitrosopumilus sp. H8]|nr:MAG: hypothetical protein EB830_04630 [Nitrosopumilus sp. H13]RNJ79357.1 MAG: hypothetical protein EB829_02330 [Nitrosopumilus sp. H8]